MTWIDDFVERVFPVDATNLQIEAGFVLKFTHIPERLFKYRDCNPNSIKNLQEDTIWLADPNSFNDPYDCHHFINHQGLMDRSLRTLSTEIRKMLPVDKVSGLEEILATAEDPTGVLIDALLGEEEPIKRAALKAGLLAGRNALFEKIAKAGDEIKAGFRLCSFSARVDSTLMWSHYARNHQGFCVQYNIKELPPSDLRSRFMFPVVYRDEVFDATECMILVNTPKFNNIHLNRAALIKGKDWSYEEEWRLVFANGLLDKPQPWKMPIPTAVYLGSHILPADEATLKEICSNKGISMFKMGHSRSHFAMTPVAL